MNWCRRDRREAKVLEVNLRVNKPARRPDTEATLLSAMETAGKRVDDEELREAMSERGLGTQPPARPLSRADHAQVCVPA